MLSDAESVRKDRLTGEYLDMCTDCIISGGEGDLEGYVVCQEFKPTCDDIPHH
jgi:hypothetical protein|tara:strand:+ start:321 stop:479 length:159 start_codon:yes stop_codon:yes gene_type:complete